MPGILTKTDFGLLVGRMGGDLEKARQFAQEQGYEIESDEPEQEALGGLPGAVGDLQGLLGQQRQSIGNLYDKITSNIEQRYRKPDINDLLVNIGMGMLTPPKEGGEGGFRGSLMRGLQGVGGYAAQQREYQQNLNKMMSDVEIAKAKDIADLESKYITGAASLLKPASSTRRTGFNPISGKLQFMDTGEDVEALPPPKVGEIRNGYRYMGGDPADRNNWVEVR